MKKTTSTTLSTTSRGMSAIVLDRKAALYGTMTDPQVRYDVIKVRRAVTFYTIKSRRVRHDVTLRGDVSRYCHGLQDKNERHDVNSCVVTSHR